MAEKDNKMIKIIIDIASYIKVPTIAEGVLGNLSLTPLYEIIYEMTELLRYQTETDYNPLINKYEDSYFLLLH